MSEQKDLALAALADFLSGPAVGHHSIGLSMPPGRLAKDHERAREFFTLRGKFNIQGYMSREEVETQIRITLGL